MEHVGNGVLCEGSLGTLGPGLQAFGATLRNPVLRTGYAVGKLFCGTLRKVSSSDDSLGGELPAMRSSPFVMDQGTWGWGLQIPCQCFTVKLQGIRALKSL